MLTNGRVQFARKYVNEAKQGNTKVDRSELS